MNSRVNSLPTNSLNEIDFLDTRSAAHVNFLSVCLVGVCGHTTGLYKQDKIHFILL